MINKLKSKIGLSILLVCFALVELSNFESLFYKFMLAFRPDWGAFNHVASLFLSFGLLSAIIVYGMRREALISWGLAVLAIIISLGVYSQISTISWNWGDWHMENLAVVILGVVCPLMVAHTTHRIANEETEEDEFEIEANIRRQARKLKQKRQHHVAAGSTTAPPPPERKTNGKMPDYEFDIGNF
ncbi:hypothetical protein [Rhodoflexus sp.]